MAELSLKELAKKFSVRHPDAGKLRYTKLNDMIANGEDFLTKTGRKIAIDYATKQIERAFQAGNLNSLKGNPRLFKNLKNGQIVRIDELQKTAEFGGGGGGSGAGSDLTELVESAQCLYCALVFYVFKRPMRPNDIVTPAQFEQTKRYIDVSEDFDKMVNELPEEWVKSSILGANKLYEKYRAVPNFIFHRGSKDVDQIENTFKKINRKERAFGNLNKWSPADMYMIKRGQGLTKITEQESLKGLNGMMSELYRSKMVVGVSLKKMERTARFSEININESKGTAPTTVDYGYKGKTIKANERSTIYDSMDVYVKYGLANYERIQFRSFGDGDGLTGFQGEIKGETANQGKASLGPVSFLFRQYANVNLPGSGAVASRVRRNDDSLCKEIYDKAKELGVDNLPTYKEHLKLCYQQEPKWRYSKYLGLCILTVLENQSKAVQDAIVKDIYYYAGSKSSFSAPYAKIEG